jgi:hypothetical protein
MRNLPIVVVALTALTFFVVPGIEEKGLLLLVLLLIARLMLKGPGPMVTVALVAMTSIVLRTAFTFDDNVAAWQIAMRVIGQAVVNSIAALIAIGLGSALGRRTRAYAT